MDTTLDELISQANGLLALHDDTSIETFTALLMKYREEFGAWQQEVSSNNPLDATSSLSDEERAAFRAKVEELGALHAKVIARAESARGDVGQELTDLHKRGNAMRQYIDQYPSRITIAGKRKG